MNDAQPTDQELLDAMLTSFNDLESRMATKDDLQSFATKEDLKAFATKEDLGKMQHDILDGVDRKLADLKGDLVVWHSLSQKSCETASPRARVPIGASRPATTLRLFQFPTRGCRRASAERAPDRD